MSTIDNDACNLLHEEGATSLKEIIGMGSVEPSTLSDIGSNCHKSAMAAKEIDLNNLPHMELPLAY